ncbi:unnamed protein product [Choristocarpus tenellus]
MVLALRSLIPPPTMVLILMSPAKTLNWATPPPSLSSHWTQPPLLSEADPVAQVLRAKKQGELKKLMSVSDTIAALNYERFQSFLPSDQAVTSTDEDRVRPAALAFDGPAFRGLDAASFSTEDWAFAGNSLRLLCGLYGVLRATDLIQPYRLEMSTRGISVSYHSIHSHLLNLHPPNP